MHENVECLYTRRKFSFLFEFMYLVYCIIVALISLLFQESGTSQIFKEKRNFIEANFETGCWNDIFITLNAFSSPIRYIMVMGKRRTYLHLSILIFLFLAIQIRQREYVTKSLIINQYDQRGTISTNLLGCWDLHKSLIPHLN